MARGKRKPVDSKAHQACGRCGTRFAPWLLREGYCRKCWTAQLPPAGTDRTPVKRNGGATLGVKRIAATGPRRPEGSFMLTGDDTGRASRF